MSFILPESERPYLPSDWRKQVSMFDKLLRGKDNKSIPQELNNFINANGCQYANGILLQLAMEYNNKPLLDKCLEQQSIIKPFWLADDDLKIPKKTNHVILPKGYIIYRGWNIMHICYTDYQSRIKEKEAIFFGSCEDAQKYTKPKEKTRMDGIILKFTTKTPLKLFVIDARGVRKILEHYSDFPQLTRSDASHLIRFWKAFGFFLGDQKLRDKIKLKLKYHDIELPSKPNAIHAPRYSKKKSDWKPIDWLSKGFLKHYDGCISVTDKSLSKFANEIIIFKRSFSEIEVDSIKILRNCQNKLKSNDFKMDSKRWTNLLDVGKILEKNRKQICKSRSRSSPPRSSSYSRSRLRSSPPRSSSHSRSRSSSQCKIGFNNHQEAKDVMKTCREQNQKCSRNDLVDLIYQKLFSNHDDERSCKEFINRWLANQS